MVHTASLESCLADLEARIDEAREAANVAAWRTFLDGDWNGPGPFRPPRRQPAPPTIEWPTVHINDAQNDPEAMLLEQFRGVSETLAAGGGGALNVRCNYGVGILASQCGCDIVQMDREQGNLPTSIPLGSRDAIRDLLRKGIPAPTAGLGAKVFATAGHFLDAFRRFPKIGRWVQLYHPDAQGPIDNAELVWGSDLFLALYDEPELMRAFLDFMTEHYSTFMRAWFEQIPRTGEYAAHWGIWFKGSLTIRNDSLMNLSPEMYREWVRPHDQRLFDEFGGGVIHFCGRGDHFIEAMSEMNGLTAVNLSQPHLNDMETIAANTVGKGIRLIGYPADELCRIPRQYTRGVQI